MDVPNVSGLTQYSVCNLKLLLQQAAYSFKYFINIKQVCPKYFGQRAAYVCRKVLTGYNGMPPPQKKSEIMKLSAIKFTEIM